MIAVNYPIQWCIFYENIVANDTDDKTNDDCKKKIINLTDPIVVKFDTNYENWEKMY